MGLACTGCGYDNDPTRVYCHNCGTKLERGAAAPPAPTGFARPTDLAKIKVLRQPVSWGRYFGALWRLAVLAALVTAVVLALLPPDDVPPPVAPDADLAARFSGLLDDASSARAARAFGLSAADVNRWLVSTVRFEGSTGGAVSLRPQRIYAVPGDGRVRVGLEVALPWKGRVFFEGEYAPVRGAQGYTLQPQGYAIGRLPLPVVLGWPVRRQFEGLAAALAGPLDQLARASTIGITPTTVILRWSDHRR